MRIRRFALGTACIGVITAAVALKLRDNDRVVRWALFADLKNLTGAEDAYYKDHATYGRDLRYTPTHGAVVRVTAASDTSWSAVATHPRASYVATVDYAEPRNATRAQIGSARVAALDGVRAQLGIDASGRAR